MCQTLIVTAPGFYLFSLSGNVGDAQKVFSHLHSFQTKVVDAALSQANSAMR